MSAAIAFQPKPYARSNANPGGISDGISGDQIGPASGGVDVVRFNTTECLFCCVLNNLPAHSQRLSSRRKIYLTRVMLHSGKEIWIGRYGDEYCRWVACGGKGHSAAPLDEPACRHREIEAVRCKALVHEVVKVPQ